MAYTIKFTNKGNSEGIELKLNRDKTYPLHEQIAMLANDHKGMLTHRFGLGLLDAYVKLKDNKGWQLICDLKLSYQRTTMTKEDLIKKLDDMSHDTYILQKQIKESLGDDNVAALAASCLYNFSNQLDDFVCILGK